MALRRKSSTDIVFVITNEISLVFLDPIIRELSADGYSVGLITNFADASPPVSIEGHLSRWAHVPMAREPRPARDIISLIQLSRALRTMRPRLAHVSTPKAGLLGTIASRLAKTPVIYQVRGFRAENEKGPLGWLLRKTERLAVRLATDVVIESDSLRASLVQEGVLREGKGRVIGHGSSIGVDVSRFSPSEEPLADEPPVCGFVGRIHKDKGISDLLWVFGEIRKSYPTARLLVIGGADLADHSSLELEAQCRETPGVTITGFVPDVVPYLRQIHILIMPTRREGLPSAPLEAQACGVPVVAYAVTGMKDAVENNTGGILVAPFDQHQLLSTSLSILASPDQRQRLQRCGREYVMSRFDSLKVVSRNCRYLESMVDEMSPGRPSEEVA